MTRRSRARIPPARLKVICQVEPSGSLVLVGRSAPTSHQQEVPAGKPAAVLAPPLQTPTRARGRRAACAPARRACSTHARRPRTTAAERSPQRWLTSSPASLQARGSALPHCYVRADGRAPAEATTARPCREPIRGRRACRSPPARRPLDPARHRVARRIGHGPSATSSAIDTMLGVETSARAVAGAFRLERGEL